ncbi:MAG: PAS domain-containing protein, partial [Deinococcota bacterium]
MSELYNGLDPYVAPALNNMMQLLWQSQHVGLCVIDANNYFVTASPTLCRWLETPLKQLQRQEFTTYIELDDADKQTVLNMYQDMMSVDTETQPSVLPLKTANGGKLKVWVHSRVSHDAQAEPVCVVLVHKLDRFIGVEEAHYRSLIEQQSQFLVTRWRPQDVVLTFVNDAYAAFYGTTRAECVGQSMLTFILPEAQKPFLDKIARAVQQAETFSTEEYVCSDAGTWHWLRWINEPIVDASGHVQFFQGMGVDVTEQVLRDRALELNDKRYREISETGVESLYSYFYVPPNELVQQTLMDKDKPADSAQDSWQWERDWEPEASTKRLTGYSLAEIDALGGWPALVHPDDLEHFNNSRHNLVAGEQREAEYRLITKTGKVIWIESRLRITAADDRPGLRVYGSDRDISDYKQVELALRQAVDEQDVMLKEIHHRVNNNMQVISSLLALQSHNVSDPQVRASLAESRARIMAMADVHREIYESPRLAGINFADYLQHIVRRVRASNAHALQIDIECT